MHRKLMGWGGEGASEDEDDGMEGWAEPAGMALSLPARGTGGGAGGVSGLRAALQAKEGAGVGSGARAEGGAGGHGLASGNAGASRQSVASSSGVGVAVHCERDGGDGRVRAAG